MHKQGHRERTTILARPGPKPLWVLPPFFLVIALLVICGGGFAQDGGTIPATIGNGRADNNKDITITNINPPLNVTGGGTVISFGNTGTITVNAGAVVQGNANLGSGKYGTGPNVIEVNSNYKINVDGQVEQLGMTTNGEAINLHGTGNTVTVSATGSLYSKNGAALWFQDEPGNGNTRNTITNYGNISTGRGAGFNVIGSSAASNKQPGIDFKNYGEIDGSLLFGGGDDNLTFGTGSKISGNVDGGGGANNLILDADANKSATLLGAVQNFTTIRKTGLGAWAILGQVPVTDPNDPHPSSPITGSLANITSLTVEGGVLSLVGANPEFKGTVSVFANSMLTVEAQGINSASGDINNNGTIVFEEGFDGVFSKGIVGNGKIAKSGLGKLTLVPSTANTYTGGTDILEGTLAVETNAVLGNGGQVTFLSAGSVVQASTLQFLDNIDFSSRQFVVNKASGDTTGASTGFFDTNGFDGIVNTAITGAGGVGKLGEGTLTLKGTNTYSGRTTVAGGVMVIDGATKATTGADVYSGTLRVLGDFGNAGSNSTVFGGSMLDGHGDGTNMGVVNGSVRNLGSITPGLTGDAAGNATNERWLTIKGDYTTANGPTANVFISTVLGDDTSKTSKLTIAGTVSGPVTQVVVTNVGGTGAATDTGIDIIQTGGSQNDSFRLRPTAYLSDGTPIVVAGDWGYRLAKGGSGGVGANPDNWYLVAAEHGGKIITPPNVTTFDTVAAAASPFTLIGTLMQRVGNRSWGGFGGAPGSVSSDEAYGALATDGRRFLDEAGVWTRLQGAKVSLAPRKSNTHQGKSDQDYWQAEAGFDIPVWRPTGGSGLILGVAGHFGGVDNTIKDFQLRGSAGEVKTHGHGVGVTLTWYGENGFYVDSVAKWTWYKSDIRSSYAGDHHSIKDNKGFGQVYSIEVGKTIQLPVQGLSMTPQAQYVHSVLENDSFTDANGDRFSYENTVGKLGRFGISLNREWNSTSACGEARRFELYGVANMYREFDSSTAMKHRRAATGELLRYTTSAEKWWAGGSVGATVDWGDNRYSAYGEIGYRATLRNSGDNHILHGEVGFRFNF